LLHSNLLACWACWREEEEEEECLVSKSINSSKSTTQTLYSSPENKLVGWIWAQRNLNLKILSALGCLLSESFWNWFSTLQIYKLWYFGTRRPKRSNTWSETRSLLQSQITMISHATQISPKIIFHFSKFPKIKHGFFICQGEFWELWEKAMGTNLWPYDEHMVCLLYFISSSSSLLPLLSLPPKTPHTQSMYESCVG
jgi:hypothetical protein